MGGAKRPRGASYEKKAPKAIVIYPGERSCNVHILLAFADDAARAVQSLREVREEGPAAVAKACALVEIFAEGLAKTARRIQELEAAPVVIDHQVDEEEPLTRWIYEKVQAQDKSI